MIASTLRRGSASEFVKVYLSREHRDIRATGCTMAALCGDAARKEDEVRATFAVGIEAQLAVLREGSEHADSAQARATRLATMAQALGAIGMSRACPDDSPLADEILQACREAILVSLTPPGTGPDAPAAG